MREQPVSPLSFEPCISQTQAWATVFQQLELSQTEIVLVSFWNPDKYGNTTTDIIYISYIRIVFFVDPIVPEDFAHFLTSEDHLCIPSSFGGFEVAHIDIHSLYI